eukprot:9494998-Pyramimonas_sp.AAC.1
MPVASPLSAYLEPSWSAWLVLERSSKPSLEPYAEPSWSHRGAVLEPSSIVRGVICGAIFGAILGVIFGAICGN